MKHLTLIFSVFLIVVAIFPDIVIGIINIIPYTLGFGRIVNPIAFDVIPQLTHVLKAKMPEYSLSSSIILFAIGIIGLVAYFREMIVSSRSKW